MELKIVRLINLSARLSSLALKMLRAKNNEVDSSDRANEMVIDLSKSKKVEK